MRTTALMLWLLAGPAFAEGEIRDADVVRLDFADAATFHSAIDSHFVLAGTMAAPRSPRVSSKVRVAMWTSHSTLPPSAEVLRPKLPSAMLLDSSPTEHIAAKTVGPPSHERSAPYHLGKPPKRESRPNPIQIGEAEQPSLLQRIVGALLPGDVGPLLPGE
jgi:hypothetical protein